MKRTRTVIITTFALLFAVALGAQSSTGGAQSGMPTTTIVAFVATWLGLLVSVLSAVATRRRDQLNLQDRVDKRTSEIFNQTVSADGWRKDRDERIREITRDLLFREFDVQTLQAQAAELKDRVEALSRRVQDIPVQIRADIVQAVGEGVAVASDRLARDRMRDMVFPTDHLVK